MVLRSLAGRAVIYFGLYHVLHAGRYGRKDIVARGRLDGIRAGAVAALSRADGVGVGHVHGDDAGSGGYAGGIAGAHG